MELLASPDRSGGLKELLSLPARKVAGPLIRALYSRREKVRWAAVEGLGAVAANLAREDMEAARVIMRRLMWSLNDESGGIGWGAAEAMAEAMAGSPALRAEFAPILVSYIDPEGNYLEHGPLRRGAVWGVMRVAREDPSPVRRAAPHLVRLLESDDATQRGLSALALGLLGEASAARRLKELARDPAPASVYLEGKLATRTVREMARDSLALMGEAP